MMSTACDIAIVVTVLLANLWAFRKLTLAEERLRSQAEQLTKQMAGEMSAAMERSGITAADQ